MDAATAGTGAVRFLVSTLGAQKLADIEPEEFYSFTDTRPLTSVVAPGERALHWPHGEFFGGVLPEPAQSDLLLFVAPEPNLKWRTYAQAMLDVTQRFGAQRLVAVGSIFGAVHHRAEVPLTGWATEPRLREELGRQKITFTNYEGPTGFVTVLLAEAQARGIPAAAILGFSPSYIQGVPNPRVSHAILQATATVSGIVLPLDDLGRTARGLIRQVDKLLLQQPDLREQVDRMLRLTGASEPEDAAGFEPIADEESSDAPGLELPSGQAIVNELEEFLKQLREKDRGSEPGPSSED